MTFPCWSSVALMSLLGCGPLHATHQTPVSANAPSSAHSRWAAPTMPEPRGAVTMLRPVQFQPSARPHGPAVIRLPDEHPRATRPLPSTPPAAAAVPPTPVAVPSATAPLAATAEQAPVKAAEPVAVKAAEPSAVKAAEALVPTAAAAPPTPVAVPSAPAPLAATTEQAPAKAAEPVAVKAAEPSALKAAEAVAPAAAVAAAPSTPVAVPSAPAPLAATTVQAPAKAAEPLAVKAAEPSAPAAAGVTQQSAVKTIDTVPDQTPAAGPARTPSDRVALKVEPAPSRHVPEADPRPSLIPVLAKQREAGLDAHDFPWISGAQPTRVNEETTVGLGARMFGRLFARVEFSPSDVAPTAPEAPAWAAHPARSANPFARLFRSETRQSDVPAAVALQSATAMPALTQRCFGATCLDAARDLLLQDAERKGWRVLLNRRVSLTQTYIFQREDRVVRVEVISGGKNTLEIEYGLLPAQDIGGGT